MKKVTLLGDSIRLLGYGKKVAEMLSGDYEVFQPEDNCRYSKYTLRGLFEWKNDIEGSDIIHWNNGLWDTCDCTEDGPFTSPEEYTETILRIAKLLKQRAKTVIFATTTPVSPKKPDNNSERIAYYNSLVVPKLQEMGIIINDLFSTVYPHIDEYICEDEIHLSELGISVCAKQVAEVIRSCK